MTKSKQRQARLGVGGFEGPELGVHSEHSRGTRVHAGDKWKTLPSQLAPPLAAPRGALTSKTGPPGDNASSAPD